MAEMVITEQNFEKEVLQSEQPVLVDFWASWCGPCKMLGPVVSGIASEFDGKLKVGKVNVDEQPKLAMQFRVSSIPTVILFKDGKAVDGAIGFRDRAGFDEMLSKI